MSELLHERPRTAPHPGRVLLLSSGVTFLAFLDATVVNVAFPDLHADFPRVPLARLTWVVSAYAVLFAALLAPAGRLADVLGKRTLFIASVTGFTLTSLAAAAAPNADLLVVARAAQGATAAGMIPAALGLVLAHTPAERRAVALGIWSAAGGLAAAVGPALGGLLVEAWDWRAIFLINLPLGTAVAYAAVRSLAREPRSARALPDPVGVTALAFGIGGVVAGLTQGQDWGWGSPSVVGLLAGGVLCGGVALARSRNHPAPAVELDLWRSRVFAMTNLGSALFGSAMYAWLLASPFFLASQWNYSVLKAGLAVTPGAFTAMVGSLVVGRLVPPTRQWAAVVVGSALFAGGCALPWLWLADSTSYAQIFLPSGLLGGLGIGAAVTGLSAVASATLPPARFAAGTGLLMTARQLGGALGIAGMAAVLAAVPGDFPSVYLMCGTAALAALLAGLGIGAASRA